MLERNHRFSSLYITSTCKCIISIVASECTFFWFASCLLPYNIKMDWYLNIYICNCSSTCFDSMQVYSRRYVNKIPHVCNYMPAGWIGAHTITWVVVSEIEDVNVLDPSILQVKMWNTVHIDCCTILSADEPKCRNGTSWMILIWYGRAQHAWSPWSRGLARMESWQYAGIVYSRSKCSVSARRSAKESGAASILLHVEQFTKPPSRSLTSSNCGAREPSRGNVCTIHPL